MNMASFPSGGALVVRGARGRGLRGEARARAKNTIRVGYSYTYSFFSPSVQTLNDGLTVRTFPPEHFFPKSTSDRGRICVVRLILYFVEIYSRMTVK